MYNFRSQNAAGQLQHFIFLAHYKGVPYPLNVVGEERRGVVPNDDAGEDFRAENEEGEEKTGEPADKDDEDEDEGCVCVCVCALEGVRLTGVGSRERDR